MAKASKNFKDRITNIESPQQKNGYDCGTYVIMYANSIAENIINNALLNEIEVKIDDVTTTRKSIYNYIKEKKELLVGEKKNENREENKNKKHMEEVEKIKDKIPEKKADVCGRWVNYNCWKGRDCTFMHPILCESDVYRTACRKDKCDLYHPQVCSTNSRGKVCTWGKDVNLDIYIIMYRDIAMKTINADMTGTIIIIVITMIIMVTKITINRVITRKIPGDISGHTK